MTVAVSISSILILISVALRSGICGDHDHMLTQFFQHRDSNNRIKSFISLARSSVKDLDQIVTVLERQHDDYVCDGASRCCTAYHPCLLGEGKCRHHWECAGDLFCGRHNCESNETGERFDCCHRLNPRPNFTLPVTCSVELTGYASKLHPCHLEPQQIP